MKWPATITCVEDKINILSRLGRSLYVHTLLEFSNQLFYSWCGHKSRLFNMIQVICWKIKRKGLFYWGENAQMTRLQISIKRRKS